jgi:hypothetical protein
MPSLTFMLDFPRNRTLVTDDGNLAACLEAVGTELDKM